MKEAYLKCLGMGLSLPLNSFSVFDEKLRKDYVIAPVDAPEGFLAAVAYPSPPLVHARWPWDTDH
jgi:phosphopantetheinyl transferase